MQLFAAHMVEHELVMAVAAPLLVIARPAAAFLWSLPRDARHAVGHAMRTGPAVSTWRALTQPATATILHGIAIWAWHVPALFDDTLANVALHRLQHVSFTATAILFWWAVLRRCNAGCACMHVFITLMHTSRLGAILTLSPRVLYPTQTMNASLWSLSPLEDQQLAGLVMWVPAGLIYAGAALTLVALWISRSGQGMRVDSRADILRYFAFQELGRASRKLNDFHAALYLAFCVRKNFSVLGGYDGSKIVNPFFKNAQKGIEDSGATQGRRNAHAGKARLACATAIWTVAWLPRWTRPLCLPVAGLNTGALRFASPDVRRPLMKCPISANTVKFLSGRARRLPAPTGRG